MSNILINPIKKLREERGYSEKEFAETFGVTLATLSNYESVNFNHNNCKLDTIRQLAAFFDIPLMDFITALDEYKDYVETNNIQGFIVENPNPTVVYRCLRVYCNYNPKVVGLKVKDKETRETKILTRAEIISLVNSRMIDIEGVTVSRNSAIKCSNKIPMTQTYRYDEVIPEDIKGW